MGQLYQKEYLVLQLKILLKKAKSLNTKKYVLKAQIHAGGRGKAGGVKNIRYY
jgi:succinyl-CoA synthetase beta subunit